MKEMTLFAEVAQEGDILFNKMVNFSIKMGTLALDFYATEERLISNLSFKKGAGSQTVKLGCFISRSMDVNFKIE